MSIKAVLAAGFLFLGGLLVLMILSLAGGSDWLILLGLLLVLLGGIPLLITLWTDFYGNEAAFPPTKSSNKEDNP